MNNDQGKTVGLQIGGTVGPNDRVGMHVPMPTASGIGVKVQVGDELNNAIKEVGDSVPNDHPKALEIRQLVNDILTEKDRDSKVQRIQRLVMIGAGITQIAVGISKITKLLGY